MSWMSAGFAEAEKMAQSASKTRRKNRNFWLKPGEEAIVRFLKPARDTINYKRAFVPWAKGQKLYTSPGTAPDPLVEAGLQLQAAFAWPILDRRVFEFEVTNDQGQKEQKKVGPRYLYFADGQMARKALIALEDTTRKDINEGRAEDGLDPLTEEEFNLTSFDVRISKAEKGWNLTAVRGGQPKPLSTADKEVIEKYVFDIAEEIKPLPTDALRAAVAKGAESESAKEEVEYAYGDDKAESGTGTADEEPTFFS